MAPAALARDACDTAVFRMEADRRPVAAKRHGLVVCSAVRLAEDVLALAAAPLRDTACFAQEARRRPAAALRTAVLTSVPVTPPAAAAAAVAAPFLATAAGAQEAARRPTAALRAGPPLTLHPQFTTHNPQLSNSRGTNISNTRETLSLNPKPQALNPNP
jgi:hypothetical protein